MASASSVGLTIDLKAIVSTAANARSANAIASIRKPTHLQGRAWMGHCKRIIPFKGAATKWPEHDA